jgi:hypothetical protein
VIKNGGDEYETPIGSAAGGNLGLDQKQRKGYEAYMQGRMLELWTAILAQAIAGTMEGAAPVARRPGRRHKSLKHREKNNSPFSIARYSESWRAA